MNEAQQYKRDYIIFCYKGMIFGLIGIIVVLIISMFMGCRDRTFIENSYSILETAKLTYDAVMASSADLYEKGILSDNDKVQLIKYGTDFYHSYIMAVDLLKFYVIVQDRGDENEIKKVKKKLVIELGQINNILFDIGQLLTPLDQKTLPLENQSYLTKDKKWLLVMSSLPAIL